MDWEISFEHDGASRTRRRADSEYEPTEPGSQSPADDWAPSGTAPDLAPGGAEAVIDADAHTGVIDLETPGGAMEL